MDLTKQGNGDLAGAIDDFTQALALDPKYVQGYSYRAAAKMTKGDLDGAIADDDQLLLLDPHNAGGFSQRGYLKQSKNDVDGAIADYTCAIQFDPKNYLAYYNRGLIEEQKGGFDNAIADYNEALVLKSPASQRLLQPPATPRPINPIWTAPSPTIPGHWKSIPRSRWPTATAPWPSRIPGISMPPSPTTTRRLALDPPAWPAPTTIAA